MTPKSYITLCTVAVIYVLMAAVAIVSPHGNRFADASYAAASDTAQVQENDTAESAGTAADTEKSLLFTSADDVKVYIPLSGMDTFSQSVITVDINGEEKSFTAVHFKTLTDWSGLDYKSDWTVFKGSSGRIFACRSVDLQKTDNAYIIYADENGQPLDTETYGSFCLYVKDGSRTGFFEDINVVDFG